MIKHGIYQNDSTQSLEAYWKNKLVGQCSNICTKEQEKIWYKNLLFELAYGKASMSDVVDFLLIKEITK